jgi:hypothetical protein
MPHQDIQGWGTDLDPSLRPAVPREHTPPRQVQPAWKEPEQQLPVKGVLHSIERPRISRVYGTSVPDSQGLVSSPLRWLAFRYSESDLRHWLILLAADRVDVVEGVFEDLLQLKVPNPFAEMGWKAEFKHAPLRGMAKVAGLIAGVGLCAAWMLRPRRRGLARLLHR